jgi:protocatechuate 3,4-dioxygenase beta subunit
MTDQRRPDNDRHAARHAAPADHDDHGGLRRDMPVLLGRRDALRWIGGMSLAGVLAACGVGTSASNSSTTIAPPAGSKSSGAETTTAPGSAAGAGTEIPDETAGPFPADGTNGPDVLTENGVLKPDITTSFGSLTGTAEGVQTTLLLTVVDAATGSPLPGAVVYLWHCTADGRYSIYEIADQNYLRGTQAADDAGRVTFTTVFPGCYPGRWPHCHFEVYASLDEASAGSSAIKTSQLALPQADCESVYADSRYGSSASNLSRLSLAADMVFADGWTDQLATVAGSIDVGYTASLLVRV